MKTFKYTQPNILKILCILTLLIKIFSFDLDQIEQQLQKQEQKKYGEYSNYVKSLNDDWQFEVIYDPRQQNSNILNKRYNTKIPSVLHLDLLKQKKIDDPFVQTNHEKNRWVQLCRVKYTKNFTLSQRNLAQNADIVFHGIDTYSTVKLNGYQILKTSNSFIIYSVPINQYLKRNSKDINTLEVIIEPIADYEKAQASEDDELIRDYAYVRKPRYHYGADWAPRLKTMGIYKKVQIKFSDQIGFQYVWVRNKIISQEMAKLNFAIKLKITSIQRKAFQNNKYYVQIFNQETKLATTTIKQQDSYTDIQITQPKFWWPNGMGEQNLYNFTLILYKGPTKLESKSLIYGIRTLGMELSRDIFQILVNGYPIYCKGSNYVPMDMFYPRLTNEYFQNNKKQAYNYKKLLSDAAQSNFNMIRIWGGGLYQSEQFLIQASRRGIMIFYDFMFSKSRYPKSQQFLENIEQEMKQQLRLMRNYPCLTIINGNTQVLLRIQQLNHYSYDNYDIIFENLIRKIIKIENPFTNFIPTSPLHGTHPEKGGDTHYWQVWRNNASLKELENLKTLFLTEFGIQSLPSIHTIKQFCYQKDLSYQTQALLSHQRYSDQFKTLLDYKNSVFSKVSKFNSQIYLTQLVQALALQKGIISQRVTKPKNNGVLYWQFNDAWPGITFSTIDYYGRWKAGQYAAKNLFQNIAIFTLNNLSVIVLNDNSYPSNISYEITVVTFEGEKIIEAKDKAYVKEYSSQIIYEIDDSLITQKLDSVLCYTRVFLQDKLIHEYVKYFMEPKQLKLPTAIVQVEYNNENNEIKLQSPFLVKNLFIDHKKFYVKLSENYFDLVPGVQKIVKVDQSFSLKQIASRLIFISLEDVLKDQILEVKTKFV